MSIKKLLFTPGPLSTSKTVKEAMLQDMGSRDYEFMDAISEIRSQLLSIGHVSKEAGYETVIIQGSGTFGVESVISSVIKKEDKLLILANGAYGERIIKMATIHQLTIEVLRFEEDEIVNPETVLEFINANVGITHLACIHSETTTGLFNPIAEIGALCKQNGIVFILDAMSSFGGVEINIPDNNIDFLISSSNKCIEGVPGFAFAICKKTELEKAKGNARTLSLDLYEQWAGLEATNSVLLLPPLALWRLNKL